GYVAQDVIKAMLTRNLRVDGARLLVMGFTFKENCPDTRNTKIADLVRKLAGFGAEVTVFDPLADVDVARSEYGLAIENALPEGPFDAILLAVKHDAIVALGADRLEALLCDGGLIYDIKGIVPAEQSDVRI
ncbi:MAG: UDP binding domain-containing protein, partial [Methyloligellaceae bacterium]